MSDFDETLLPETLALKHIFEEQRPLIRRLVERSLEELNHEIHHQKQRIAIAKEIIAKRKRLNYFQNHPKRCGRIAIWLGLTLSIMFSGYMLGSRHGWDTATDDGIQKGYRIVAHWSILSPDKWHQYVRDVTGK